MNIRVLTFKLSFDRYNMEEFCRIVDYLHNSVPEVTIATDIICGFPGCGSFYVSTLFVANCVECSRFWLINWQHTHYFISGETEEDFQQSLDVCEKYKFPSLFINQVRIVLYAARVYSICVQIDKCFQEMFINLPTLK